MALLKRKKITVNKTVSNDSNGVSKDHIAEEMYRKNMELANTNHTLSLLRTIDNLVLEPENSLRDLSQGIASALVENSNYLFSIIFIKNTRDSQMPLQLGGFGFIKSGKETQDQKSIEYLEKVEMYADERWFEALSNSVIIDVSKVDVDFLKHAFKNRANDILELSKLHKSQTICAIKLLARRKLVGVMLVGLSASAGSLNVNEIEYLGRIGEAAGIALDNKLLFEENQNVLKKLKQSNEKLKALDEAKDEFISMASHQLRTPLTSVKGYVSMVLDGDVGKVSSQQRQLLEQAFTSSQRMVYLIADLLNVSRLKTGKFIIEPVQSQLADVVESEIGQLKEAVKVHNLELKFDKPANFPLINIDETKTRQVIMNFIDNAIYYTPAGGHIKVELTADDKAITFKVIDDGLGVPKAEQAHLFTKFFRAGNAKKARPDGTGLGLFMAKKVIVAQGGSLIFESEEGKGSTFGFILPLQKPHTSQPAQVRST